MEGNKNCVSFEVDWFDPIAKIIQSMYLKFFMDNNTLELLQGSKFFLARIYFPEVVRTCFPYFVFPAESVL